MTPLSSTHLKWIDRFVSYSYGMIWHMEGPGIQRGSTKSSASVAVLNEPSSWLQTRFKYWEPVKIYNMPVSPAINWPGLASVLSFRHVFKCDFLILDLHQYTYLCSHSPSSHISCTVSACFDKSIWLTVQSLLRHASEPFLNSHQPWPDYSANRGEYWSIQR